MKVKFEIYNDNKGYVFKTGKSIPPSIARGIASVMENSAITKTGVGRYLTVKHYRMTGGTRFNYVVDVIDRDNTNNYKHKTVNHISYVKKKVP